MRRMIEEVEWGFVDLVLKTGEHAEKGHLACIETATGQIVRGNSGAGLIPFGLFYSTREIVGDGVTKVTIKLFRAISAYWWANDDAAPVAAAEVGSIAYLKDDVTASADDTGRSPLGLVLAVDDVTKSVLVYSALPFLPV